MLVLTLRLVRFSSLMRLVMLSRLVRLLWL